MWLDQLARPARVIGLDGEENDVGAPVRRLETAQTMGLDHDGLLTIGKHDREADPPHRLYMRRPLVDQNNVESRPQRDRRPWSSRWRLCRAPQHWPSRHLPARFIGSAAPRSLGSWLPLPPRAIRCAEWLSVVPAPADPRGRGGTHGQLLQSFVCAFPWRGEPARRPCARYGR